MASVETSLTSEEETERLPGSLSTRAGVPLRESQQAATHALGLRAIAGVPLDDLYGYAVRLIQGAMQADFVYVVQLREVNELVVRAHVGRDDMDPVGRVVSAGNSIADYVIRTGEPVVTADFDGEDRYFPLPSVAEAGARSAAAVPVGGRHGPFGAIVVLNTEPDQFDDSDVAFLQTTANVLAAAVDRSADGSALRRQQELFRAITEYGRELIMIVSATGTITYVSPSGARMLGTDPITLVGRPFVDIFHEGDRESLAGVMSATADDGNAAGTFSARARREGDEWLRLTGTAYNMLHHSAVQGIVINARDVSDVVNAQEALNRSQEQLHQALKMEAVGRLAGGIAHDFNNLLTAIRGYSDMVALGLRPADPLRADVQEIQRAADRAASLTHQLLAFSRRQVLRPDRVDIGLVVRDLDSMFRRLIGEDIQLSVTSDATRTVLVDRGQLEQVMLNLVINARDAMPSGGTLIIETRDHDVLTVSPTTAGAPPPGRYVLVRVEDSGRGIPPEIVERIFEPFFTTKGPGKGTGLGLSTAYGIVKQSGGFIDVTSVEGAGAVFRILLPETEPGDVSAPAAGADAATAPHRSGGETVLLVEDADAVRQVVHRALVRMGYRVLEAANGPQAIGLALEHASEIDLLLTDFVMPHMGGRELIDRLRELGISPEVLIMSGYIDDALLRGGSFPAGAAFIEKPFTAESLGRKVRDVLEGARSRSSLRQRLRND